MFSRILYLILLTIELRKADKLSVLKSELKRGVQLSCPYDGFRSKSFIYWVNESHSDYGYLNLLTPVLNDRLLLNFTRAFKAISCGYYYNKTYSIIKLWNFSYVERAEVELTKIINEDYLKLRQLNETTFKVDYFIPNENSIQFKCEPNFDRPYFKAIFLEFISFDKHEKIILKMKLANTSSQIIDTKWSEFINLLTKLYNFDKKEAYISIHCVIDSINGVDKVKSNSLILVNYNSEERNKTLEILLIIGSTFIIIISILSFIIIFYFFCFTNKN
jgi:hypothetical protein